jgi:DNA-binding transcriptional MerR regulator
MDVQDAMQAWRIGRLAAAAGVSVRTLRQYDAIGLLRPSARTEAGYRLYSDAGVRRLYRILALRSLGLRLDEIGAHIEADAGCAGCSTPAPARRSPRSRSSHRRRRR